MQKRRIAWRICGVASLISVLALLLQARRFFFMGIAVHDTIYMANPTLGPDGWLKYTSEVFDSFMPVLSTVFWLFITWVFLCTGLVAFLSAGARKVEPGDGEVRR